MQNLLTEIFDPIERNYFQLCQEHLVSRLTDPSFLDHVLTGSTVTPNPGIGDYCAECWEAGEYDAYMDGEGEDDGDYPGVERDENMSRIEGDDFWMDAEPVGCE